MAEIKQDDYVFFVDVQKTKKYYQESQICTCDACQYLHSTIRGKYPELEAFLADFGIDIARFDEAASVELDGRYLYLFVGYTVCGQVVDFGERDIVLPGTDGIRIGVDAGFLFPNHQQGDYFSLSVSGISLSCETAKEYRAESLGEKIHRIFRKNA